MPSLRRSDLVTEEDEEYPIADKICQQESILAMIHEYSCYVNMNRTCSQKMTDVASYTGIGDLKDSDVEEPVCSRHWTANSVIVPGNPGRLLASTITLVEPEAYQQPG